MTSGCGIARQLCASVGELIGFGILLLSMGRVPTVGGMLPSRSASGPFAGPGDSLFEFPLAPLDPYFFLPGTTPSCFANLAEWDGTTAGAANLTIGTTMHFALSDMKPPTCPSPPSPPAPPLAPPPVIAYCAIDEECPAGYVCSLASRAARTLLFSSMPTRGQCVQV